MEHLRAAADTLADPELRARATNELAGMMLYLGRPTEGQDLALRAHAELPHTYSDLRDEPQALAVYAITFGAVRVLDAGELPAVPRTRGSAMLPAAVATTQSMAGQPHETSLEKARRCLEVDGILDDDNPFWVGATFVMIIADRYDEALDVYRRALIRGQRRGSRFTALTVRTWEGPARLRMGRLDEAQTLLERAIDELSKWGIGIPAATSQPLAFLAETRMERDDLAGATDALDMATATEGYFGTSTGMVLAARGEVLLAQDRHAEALDVAEQLAGLPLAIQNPNWIPWRSLLARSLPGVSRHQEALRIAHDDVECAQRWGAPSGIGRTLRVLGELEGDDGLPQLRRAVSALAASPARLECAKALAALGAASPEPERTRLLRDALAQADSCGATRLARRLRTALGASGAA
jgi:tetratricopeptide (TPR) repeat protein